MTTVRPLPDNWQDDLRKITRDHPAVICLPYRPNFIIVQPSLPCRLLDMIDAWSRIALRDRKRARRLRDPGLKRVYASEFHNDMRAAAAFACDYGIACPITEEAA